MKNFEKEWEIYNQDIAKHNMSRGMYMEDLYILLEHVSWLHPGDNYVEVGVSNGSSLLAVSKFRPDIWCYGVEISTDPKPEKVLEAEEIKNATIIRGDSTEICKTWEDPIDFLLIDGDHTSPQLFYDVIGWLPYVKTGSFILFHDFEHEKEGKPKHEIYLLDKIFRGHEKYQMKVFSEEGISSSMMEIKKL